MPSPAMNIVSKSTIEFHSDIPQPVHETHKCGILHAKNNQSGEEHSQRQHCFVWLSDTSHFANAHDHLVQSGYDDVVFIPYSCQKSWIENHPSAPLHMYTDSNGNCVNTATYSAHPSSTNTASSSSTVVKYPQLNKKKKKCLFEDAILSHYERDALHIQIYRYFAWLHSHLAVMEAEDTGRRAMSRAGVSIRAVENVIREMEGIRAVSFEKEEAATTNNEDNNNIFSQTNDNDDDVPLLERALVDQMEKIAKSFEDNNADAARPGNKKGRTSQTLDFDDMFGRLMAYREIHGHVDVPHKYKDDKQLAQWVCNIRVKKKKFDQQQLEQQQLDQQTAAVTDDGNINNEEASAPAPAEAPKNKRRGRMTTLTQANIDRLNDVGFTWTFDRAGQKSWEERYQDLCAFQRENGHCNVPRKEGVFGEWVHTQRRHYRNREPNFMKYRCKLLQDIGFEFVLKESTRTRATWTWSTGFQELEAFGKINGHYNVPCPIPPHLEAEGYHGDDESIATAFRLYRWVNKVHKEYHLYANGKYSRLMNEERVEQLRGIGFTLFD